MLGRRIRVAVVGAGKIAEAAHIPAYLTNRHADLVAIADTNEKQLMRVSKKFKIRKTYLSVDDLLQSEEIDALSICTPPDTHSQIALKAFNNDAHVFCEKPLATNVDNGREMVAASIDHDKILMIGFNRRFLPNYQRARQYALSGRLGKVYCVEDHFLEPNPLYGWGKSEWFVKPNVGGVLLDISPHVFDMLNFILNDFPVAISASSIAHLDQPVEDCCVFIVEYADGKVGVGTTSWLSSTVMENINVYGTAQNLFVSPDFFLRVNPTEIRQIGLMKAALESLVGTKFQNLPILRGSKQVNTYQLEIDCFLDHIRNGKTTHDNALNGLSVLATSQMAKEAIENNRRMQIPSPQRLLEKDGTE